MYVDAMAVSPFFSQICTPNNTEMVCCPTTGRQFSSIVEWRQVNVQDQDGVWWHCPECKGWHITFPEQSPDLFRVLKK
ncbi:MAG: hypothetical protein FOGNACKC_00585 [Anaerolineae bacterium]|nr:hypothetical protein [Anaerolineae bacterium]